MLTAREIIDIYIDFFEHRKHKRIPNSPLVPENDPSTLFTGFGMQPLVPYLLGESHPQGKRLVNVQNCFRAQDIDEVGDNRHTTFFRMLGNWSLGDYFKEEQLPWFFEFLTEGLKIDPKRLYISVFAGFENIPKDEDSYSVWERILNQAGIDPKERIFYYGPTKNWWSRSGLPENMPAGEPGGPDSEVFFDLGIEHNQKYGEECHPGCDCGRFLEIGNSVFMQYQKQADGLFKELPQKNVDFGGGLERLLAAVEDKSDIFQTSLFLPIIKAIEKQTQKDYQENASSMRIIIDHFVASCFMAANDVIPSNKERGYIQRRLIRRGLDNFYKLDGKNLSPVVKTIIEQYKNTDPDLVNSFEKIETVLLKEEENYKRTLESAKKYISKRYQLVKEPAKKIEDELMGKTEISAEDAFILYSTHGLSPTQIESLGYSFDGQAFAQKMEEHQKLSKTASAGMFKGGLVDTSEETIKGHTATHLLHQALRDVLGKTVKQKGSNITPERVRFDFNYEKKLTEDEIKKVEEVVNQKINENIPVSFEIMNPDDAKKSGAIGLFDEKYGNKVKVYSIGDYSKEICGGPHVDFTGKLKSFKIIKQKTIGQGIQRIYASLGN